MTLLAAACAGGATGSEASDALAGGDEQAPVDAADGTAADDEDVPAPDLGWGDLGDTLGDTADRDTKGADAGPDADDATPTDSTAPPTFDHLFGTSELLTLEIELAADALAALHEDTNAGVDGKVTLQDQAIEGVLVRLEGSEQSFRGLDGKAGFLLAFDHTDSAGRIGGLRRLRCSNLVRDPSMLREWLAWRILRELGVQAPRSSFVWVRVSGEDYGLYLATEVFSDPDVTERWLGSAATLYAAAPGADLTTGRVDALGLVAGDPASEALTAAVAAVVEADVDRDDIVALLQTHLGPDFLTLAAVEIVTSHRDGYWRGRANFALGRRASGGPWSMAPIRWERSFDQVQRRPFEATGAIGRVCIASVPCRLAMRQHIGAVLDVVEQATWRSDVLAAAQLVRPAAAQDPRREQTLDDLDAAIAQTLDFLVARPAWLRPNLACADPADVDADGDGFSGCNVTGADCNDDDPSVHPGAEELCNLRDDDCDGVWDNADGCPGCVPASAPDGYRLWLCFQPLDYAEARAACAELGGDLVSLPDEATEAAVRGAALDLWWNNWWIGLDDLAEEGTFVWTDGTPLDYTRWASGEPNDSNGEDCVHLTAWAGGAWNDLACDRKNPYICKETASR